MQLFQCIVKYKRFKESEVAEYVKQILAGLDYLHSQGVVHRDVKGANILLSGEDIGKPLAFKYFNKTKQKLMRIFFIVKLADFGVATLINENQKTQSMKGTPFWSK